MTMLFLLACASEKGITEPPPDCSHTEWAGIDVSEALHVGSGQPYATITSALADATDGSVVAIHAGTYTESLVVNPDGVTLVGECRDSVTVVGEEGQGVIALHGVDATVGGLTVQGGQLVGVEFAEPGGRIVSSAVMDTEGWAVMFGSGAGVVEDTEIGWVTCFSDSNALCLSVSVGGDATVEVRDSWIHDYEGLGVWVEEGASVDLEDTLVEAGRPGAQAYAVAVLAQGYATLGQGTRLVGARGIAVEVTDGGTVETVGDVEIARTFAFYLDDFAIASYDGGTLTLGAGLSIHDNEGTAIGAATGEPVITMDGVVIQGNCIVDAVRPALYFESPSTVTIANTVVRDHSCGGLQHMGGTIAMSNVQFEENRGYGVYLGGSSATLDGVGIADTAGGSDFEGIGLLAWNSTLSTGSGADPELEIEDSRDLGLVLSSGHASLDHVTITRSGAAGLAVIAANVELSHARISGTRTATERSWGGFGVYASLLDGSTSTRYAAPDPGAPVLTLRDSIIDDNEVAGIAVADGADALIDGVSVWSTRPGPSEEGDGLRALGDAFVTVEGLETSGNARASILYDGSAGSISASTGDEPIGVVVQDCLGVDQVVIDDDADFADVSMCDTGTPLPASITALTYSNDISVEE